MRKPDANDTSGRFEFGDISVGGSEMFWVASGKETTRKLIGVLLDGEDSPTLGASTVVYTLQNGDRVTAACHKAYGHYPENADLIAINLDDSAVTGIDGLQKDGSKIAWLLGKEMLFEDVDAAAANTFQDITPYDKKSAAGFAQARIIQDKNGKFLRPSQAGDIRIVVTDEQGNLVWESTDEDLATKMADQGTITHDQALYNRYRGVVTNCIGYGQVPSVTHSPDIPLKPGYRVIVASDGLFDNLTTEEFLLRIKGKDAMGIIHMIETVVLPRMERFAEIIKATKDRATAGVFADDLRSEPKPDNISIGVIDIV